VYTGSTFQSDAVIGIRRGLVVPPAPAVVPAALDRPGSIDTQRPAVRIATALARVEAPPVFGGDNAVQPMNFPHVNPGGAPPAMTGGMSAALSALPPGSRSILKVLPFVAAAYFYAKGDQTLALASAGAGVAAIVWL